jgi:excisionase family DNA binding protein
MDFPCKKGKFTMPSQFPKLLTTAEAAAYVGTGKSTLRRYIREGKVTALRVGPKLLRFETDALDRAAHKIG